ncbi:hypothetical protein RUM43_003328 [Polyplax serrata]|uniref:BED-type domain-containing protein n=1 Tax=Polyplax serrata TaxID=468196 RepID=A0AAN8S9D4_POLSC
MLLLKLVSRVSSSCQIAIYASLNIFIFFVLEFQFRFNPKRVPIWDFYTVNYDYEIAVCKVCKKIIKTRRKDGTRNVLSHMRNLHPEQYALALQYKEQWKSMKRRQCFDLLAPDN